jgi:hypothetical protein
MLSVIKGRVIGRNGNIVVVDFSREPNPPAPRFPGASGLREQYHNEFTTRFAPFAVPELLAQVRPPPAPAGRFERLSWRLACG